MKKTSKIWLRLFANQRRTGHFIYVRYHGKWGVYNHKWEQILPIEFDEIHFNFLNYVFEVTKEGNGIFDREGNEIIPPKYDQVIKIGKFYLVKKDKLSGVFDKNGKQIVPVEYNVVSVWEDVDSIVVEYDRKMGMYNTEGQMVLPTEYRYIEPHKNHIVTEKNYRDFKYMLRDKSGKLLDEKEYDQICVHPEYIVFRNGKEWTVKGLS